MGVNAGGFEPNHYAELGVERSATPARIRAAHRRLLRALHPDLQHAAEQSDAARPGPSEDRRRERLRRVMDSFEVLGDPESRAAYDRRTAPATNPPPAHRDGTAAPKQGAGSEPALPGGPVVFLGFAPTGPRGADVWIVDGIVPSR